jgi:hypothetical protein
LVPAIATGVKRLCSVSVISKSPVAGWVRLLAFCTRTKTANHTSSGASLDCAGSTPWR